MKFTDELEKELKQALTALGENEARVVEHLEQRTHISRNTNRQFTEKLTSGQRLADRVAAFVGTWTFIISFVVILVLWTTLNTVILARGGRIRPLSLYFTKPHLSMFAALQAPLIIMSQSRQAAKDRLEAEHDYEVNLKAELEILALHKKMDTLLEQHIDLLHIQREQLEVLTRLSKQIKGAER